MFFFSKHVDRIIYVIISYPMHLLVNPPAVLELQMLWSDSEEAGRWVLSDRQLPKPRKTSFNTYVGSVQPHQTVQRVKSLWPHLLRSWEG